VSQNFPLRAARRLTEQLLQSLTGEFDQSHAGPAAAREPKVHSAGPVVTGVSSILSVRQ
jgi:hypothetical protein